MPKQGTKRSKDKQIKTKESVVYIEWADAETRVGWFNEEGVKWFMEDRGNHIETGFLVKENKELIVLAKAKARDWRDISKIYKANIIKRIDLT